MFNLSGNKIILQPYFRLSFFTLGVILKASLGIIVANIEDGVDPTRFYIPPEWKPKVVHVVSANRGLKDRGIEVILKSIEALFKKK